MCPDTSRADDSAFDAIYPLAIRLLSRRFWTPVAVARRAGELLRDAGAKRVLDVGAGVGKFVLAAAAAAPGLRFVGVEQRRHLVAVARDARERLGIPNASFRAGDVTVASWGEFDGLYFFNPLAENLFTEEDRLDDRTELTRARFVRDMLAVEQALIQARVGTVVVTYHGSSARMPDSYALEHSERAGTDWLRLWTKRRPVDGGTFFVEIDDEIVQVHGETGLKFGT